MTDKIFFIAAGAFAVTVLVLALIGLISELRVMQATEEREPWEDQEYDADIAFFADWHGDGYDFHPDFFKYEADARHRAIERYHGRSS